ncbi:hypothetical protein [Pontiella sulfatireligans]|uniref:Uncharacterized protein n=1 Tax=Pontiella sulfatireligans TaxID=2750658 RepID=A0A6C2UKN1_9BACT|nr:hypothetical protein [Pontiella sulfatireligans]VGO19864.1 hypothetical protein SCARR_01924 [Pontiella sulfatireligans]
MKFSPFVFIWSLVLVGFAILVGVSSQVGPETRAAIFKESGLIETMSAVGYFVAFGLLLFLLVKQKNPAGWSLCIMLLCFGFREMDFDKRFTSMGIFKSRFYSSAEVLLPEKIMGLLITVALLVCLFFVIKTYFRPFLSGLKKLDPSALTVFFALGLMVFAKSIDGLPRKLKPLGIMPTDQIKELAKVLEESLETAVPFLLIAAIWGAYRAVKANSGNLDEPA